MTIVLFQHTAFQAYRGGDFLSLLSQPSSLRFGGRRLRVVKAPWLPRLKSKLQNLAIATFFFLHRESDLGLRAVRGYLDRGQIRRF